MWVRLSREETAIIRPVADDAGSLRVRRAPWADLRLGERLRGLVVAHWQLVLVLAVGAVLRAACEVAYHPALFYADSWEYLGMALQRPFVGFQVDRPSGYPLLVWLFTLDNRSLILLTGVQHLAGLLTAALVYVLGLRLRLGRWLAAAVAALVALCGDWIALEQFLMTEPLFSLCIVAAALLAMYAGRSNRLWALSGGLIAFAATMRTGGLFLVPPWLLFMLIRRVGWRAAVSGALALTLPLLAYCALYAADGRGFGMTETSGWFLYARLAPIAECTADWPTTKQLRAICPTAAEQADGWSPGDYLWDAPSPVNRVYGGMYSGNVQETSAVLKTFALQAFARRPGAYISMVWSALLSVFNSSSGGWESTVVFPAAGATDWVDPNVKREYVDTYHRRERAPQSKLRAY
jgi:hypothetical protein